MAVKTKQDQEGRDMKTFSVIAALSSAGYRTFASALDASGYGEVLDSGPFTLFAPTDAAFSKFSHGSLDRLLHGDPKRLQRVMGYHFVAGKVRAARLSGKRYRAKMFGGADLIINGKTGLRINDATVTEPDISAGDCVAHGIDGVLWPREPAAAAR